MFLTVEPTPGKEGEWQVVPYRPAEHLQQHPQKALRTFPSRAAAWHLACWHRFEQEDTMPKITPGDMFVPAEGRGYTSDPRFAEAVPASTLDGDTYIRAKNAITKFIRAKVGDMTEAEALGVEPEPEQQPAGEPESEPEAPAEPERRGCPTSQEEARRMALSEADAQRYENFMAAAEEAPTETARSFWAKQASDILSGV